MIACTAARVRQQVATADQTTVTAPVTPVRATGVAVAPESMAARKLASIEKLASPKC